MRRNYGLFLAGILIVALCLLPACKKNPETEPGFFLTAEPIVVNTDSLQGSSNHGICDIWLYVNGHFQGAYPSGQLMPIISKNESVHVEALAGIKNNGIDGTRIYWQPYARIAFDTLVPYGYHVKRTFQFTYNPTVTFLWVEGFEGSSGITLVKSPVSETGYQVLPTGSGFEGNSVEMSLKPTQIIGQLESASSYSLPLSNSNVYLELNYRCNTEVRIGLVGVGTGDKEVIRLNPKAEWNKIYIQLSAIVNTEPKASSYKVYFQMINNGNDAWMQIDNIKLLYL